jgi:hypothetical protein
LKPRWITSTGRLIGVAVSRLVVLLNFWGCANDGPPMKDRILKITAAELTEQKALFVQEKSEQVLQRTIDDRDAIQKRGTFLLGAIAAILTFGIGWLTKNWDAVDLGIKVGAVTQIGILAILAMPLIQCYMPSLYCGKGYDPAKMMEGEYLNQPIENMLIGYAHELQRRIKTNRDQNDSAALNLKVIATSLFLSPIIVGVFTVIGSLLSACVGSAG